MRKTLLAWFVVGICFGPSSLFTELFAKEIELIMRHDEHAGIGGGNGGGGGASLGKGKGGQSPKGGHQNNIRPSTKEKHQNADARRQREQKKAQEKKENNKKK